MSPRELLIDRRDRQKRVREICVLNSKWRAAYFWRKFDQLVREGM